MSHCFPFHTQSHVLFSRTNQQMTSPATMGAKPTTALPPTPNVMPMVPPMMSSPVVGTMPPPPAVATPPSTGPSVASSASPSAMVPPPPPSSEVTSNASSGDMGSPSLQQMMPATFPDVPLFGTGPSSNTAAMNVQQTFIPSETFQVNASRN